MFEKLSLYSLTQDCALPEVVEIEEKLAECPYNPIGATQQKTVGFVPPRGQEHGAFVEVIGGHYIVCLAIETKSVPASEIRKIVDKKVDAYTQETGRERVGRKLKNEFKEEALNELLPAAFPKRSDVLVWIDPETRRVVVGSASPGKCDDTISAMVAAIPGLAVQHLQPKLSPQAMMTSWLTSEPEDMPMGFYLERECTLKAVDESKATVKFSHHTLQTTDIKTHIREGKLPTQLAIGWEDKVSFVLTDSLRLKKVTMLGVGAGQTGEAEDAFDADVAIATGTLTPCIDALILALGGIAEAE